MLITYNYNTYDLIQLIGITAAQYPRVSEEQVCMFKLPYTLPKEICVVHGLFVLVWIGSASILTLLVFDTINMKN